MRDTQAELPWGKIVTFSTKLFGSNGEDIAVSYLKKEGYKIVERNYRASRGEIDIIAYDGERLAFIEVKARRNKKFGEGQWAVDLRKQRQIIRASLNYMMHRKLKNMAYRFDTVTVEDGQADGYKVMLIKDAFQPDGSAYNV